jgi:hypothetical protein
LFIIISYISYIGIAVGVQLVSPESLDNLDYYVKMYVSLFLLFRFNPFQKIKFNELDRKIAFSAGIFLVTTTVINTVVQKYAGALIGLIDL